MQKNKRLVTRVSGQSLVALIPIGCRRPGCFSSK